MDDIYCNDYNMSLVTENKILNIHQLQFFNYI